MSLFSNGNITKKVTLFNFKCLKLKKNSEEKSSVGLKSVLVLIVNYERSTYNTCTQICTNNKYIFSLQL